MVLINNKKTRTIDLNLILQYLCVILLGSIWVSYYLNGENEYVDVTTIILGTLLSIELLIFLKIEKKRRDPFVILLCFQMVFFYLLRILTLSIYPVSFTLIRFSFTSQSLNYAIIFIMIANLFLYLGLYLNKTKTATYVEKLSTRPKNVIIVFFVLMFVYFITYAGSSGIKIMEILVGFISNLFVNVVIIMFMVSIYIIVFNKVLSKKNKALLIIGLLFYIIIATLVGSRSSIITIFYFFLIATLAIYGAAKLKKSFLIIGIALFPVLILFFTVATFLRPRLADRGNVSGETINVLKEFSVDESFAGEKQLFLAPVFDRIGFLDYASEIIAHKNQYAGIFNAGYYFKSIVDNVLSPGFDLFDTPKASNGLRFMYNGNMYPQKSKVTEWYQSDEFTFFGEMYCLFGKWFSLIPIFFTGFFVKRIFNKITASNEFFFYVKRSFVLYVFFILLGSFGLDWLLFDVIGIMFTYLICKPFFKFQRVTNYISSSQAVEVKSN